MVNLFEYASMTESEKEFERVLLSSDIEVEKVFKEFTMSLALEGIDGGVMLEASNPEKNGDNKFVKAIDTIIEKIGQILTAICNLFKDLFKKSPDEEKAMDAYFTSSKEQIRFENDVRKIRQDCEVQIAEGNKLIKLISSKTGAQPSEVRDFCTKTVNVAKASVPVVLPTFIAWGIKKAMGYNKGKDDMYDKIKDASNVCKNINEPEKRKMATEILTSMSTAYRNLVEKEKSFAKRLASSFNKKTDKPIE